MTPQDLSIHWVWLPLFHYISAGVILIGGNMMCMRFINIIIVALIPLLLFYFIYNHQKEKNLFTALLSSILCALFPIGIIMGTTAQPEPLFMLLILSFIIFITKNKFIFSSIILTLAVLLRYESWIVVFIFGIIYFFDMYKKNKNIFKNNLKSLLPFLNVIIPVIAILIWVLLRYHSDGKFFGFLHDTKRFANDALNETNSFDGGIINLFQDLFHYPLWIPILFMGINFLFIPFGFLKTYRENRWLFVVSISILCFITISWILKSNLGLNRHFVSLIPLYSVMTANGVLVISNYKENKKAMGNIKNRLLNIKKLLLILLFMTSASYLVMWLYIWQNNYKSGYPERIEAINYLKKVDKDKTIFCNDAIFEVLSEIDYKIFNHIWMEDNPQAIEIIKKTAKQEGEVFIISSEDKIKNLKGIGEEIFRSKPNLKTGFKVIILKLKN